MSQEKPKARHPQGSKLLSKSVSRGCAVIKARSSDLKVPLQKRKDEAKQTLYLKRI